MSRTPPEPSNVAGAIDWDALIENPYDAGPLSRVIHRGESSQQWVIALGMKLDLAETVFAHRYQRDKERAGLLREKLLVFADTVVAKTAEGAPVSCDAILTDVVVMARHLDASARVLVEKSGRTRASLFHLGFHAASVSPPDCKISLTRRLAQPTGPEITGTGELSDPRGPSLLRVNDGEVRWGKNGFRRMPFQMLDLPLAECLPLLERMLFTAQTLAAEGRTALAAELLERLHALLALSPGERAWRDVAFGCQAMGELMQPVPPETDRVPYLSLGVYSELAKEHVPALQAYSATFANFMNRSHDLEARKRAAKLILGEKEDAAKFQQLVATQLDENFELATAAVRKAQAAIDPQAARVKAAEAQFQDGLDEWKAAKEREATMAVVGSVFAFIGGVASVFVGNAAGAAGAAKAAADVATTAAKLADLMKQLARVALVIQKLFTMSMDIAAALRKVGDAKGLADRLSAVTRESASEDAKGAPSAGAYWDQFWVEVETQLAPAIREEVGGAREYLKELKVLIIYGRALTAAQAALPPLVQEMARAALQSEIAGRQRATVLSEIETLKAGQAATGQAVVALWGNYRAVQRSMLVALQNFDGAYRYWALTDAPPPRDTNRHISDLALDLKEIADIKDMQARALESFRPAPQSYVREEYEVPADARDALLAGEGFTVRFTPTSGPFAGWGRVGRVRVSEIFVWVEWVEGKRPATGKVEFTVRTDGAYDDQRVVAGKLKTFHFIGPPLDLTFRYDLKGFSPEEPVKSVRVRAAIASDFRASYSEPTLFTGWRISVPKQAGEGGALDLTKLKSAVSGITLEFSGTYIKDPERALRLPEPLA